MLLRMGDRGEAVKVVQQALREAGFDIVVDGIFGRNTRAAVMEFQRQSSLTVDGIVGPPTLSAPWDWTRPSRKTAWIVRPITQIRWKKTLMRDRTPGQKEPSTGGIQRRGSPAGKPGMGQVASRRKAD
jgi:murein L,D-transpeptidase YcbB/YkuD